MSGLPLPFTRATPAFFLAACAWGLVLLLAFAGWGRAVARAGGRARLDFGLRAALGLALAVAAGGVLNLAGLLSRPVVLVFAFVGAALEVLGRRGDPAGTRRWSPLLALAAILAAVQFAGSVHGTIFTSTEYFAFDPHDDEQAYLAFPLKMLETGGLGNEPFDARRLNLLGGQSFLLAFVLAVLPVRAAHLLDGGVGFLAALAVLAGAARRRGLSARHGAVVLLVFLALPVMAARGNTTALATGIALLLAAWRLVAERPFESAAPFLRSVPLGLVAAALGAIKSTFLPAVGLFVLFDAGLSWGRDRDGRRARDAAWAGVFTVAFLLPWMISLKLSSGTFLFPVLGRGVQGSLPWNLVSMPADAGMRLADVPGFALRSLSYAVPLVLLGVLAIRRAGSTTALAFGLMAVAVTLVYRFMGDPFLERSIYRYFFPVFASALVVLLVEGLAGSEERAVAWRSPAGALVLLGTSWVLLRSAPVTSGTYVQAARNAVAAVSGGDVARAPDVARTRALLGAVPAGAPVLVRVERPWALDFRAHRVFLDSMPGMASPPPGLPLFRGPEPVARYLENQGIHYLVYADREGAGGLLRLTSDDIRYRYSRSRSRWAIYAFHHDFFHSVRELSFTRRRLAAGDGAFVLDLSRRALALPVLEAPERLSGVTADGWTLAGRPAAVARLGYERGADDRFLRVARSGYDPDPGGVAVRVWADGWLLALVRQDEEGLVFDLRNASQLLDEVTIEAAARPGRATASASGPAMGLDLLGLATLPEPSAPSPLAPRPAQEVSATINPAAVSEKSGFFADNNWTNGDGLLANLRYVLAPGDEAVTVALLDGPPPEGPAAPGLRLFVNGIEVPRLAVNGGLHVFRLEPRPRMIRRIRVVSPVFVPRDEGRGEDRRRLGVAVESIRIGSADAAPR